MKWIILLYVIPIIYANRDEEKMIGGGNITDIKPYQALLLDDGYYMDCIGTIIHESVILATAGCLFDVQVAYLSVVVGDIIWLDEGFEGGSQYPISTVKIHQRSTIGIARTLYPMWIYDKVKPIKLVTDTIPENGTMLTSGRSWDEPLKVVTAHPVNHTYCNQKIAKINLRVSASVICAFNITQICYVEGAPLVFEDRLIGIASGAVRCGGPFLFESARSYAGWINYHLPKLL